MKLLKPALLLSTALIFIVSCTSHVKYRYAIKDFRQALQPALVNIVTKGIVDDDTSTHFLQVNATDKELEQLSYSEHPLLRAVALRLRGDRDTTDNFNIVMGHLDDTAIVPVDRGEFGIDFLMVTDDMIRESIWKTEQERRITIDSVVTRHNYLMAAYTALGRLNHEEKYYPYIRKMVLQKKAEELGRARFWLLEEAIFSLAGYRKKEDIPLIKQILVDNAWRIGQTSFALISKFPDTAYLAVLGSYARFGLYVQIRDKRSYEDAENFMATVAEYKQVKSAKILERMLNGKPFVPRYVDSVYLQRIIKNAIWNNQCNAYAQLLKQIGPEPKRDNTNDGIVLDTSVTIPPQKIRW